MLRGVGRNRRSRIAPTTRAQRRNAAAAIAPYMPATRHGVSLTSCVRRVRLAALHEVDGDAPGAGHVQHQAGEPIVAGCRLRCRRAVVHAVAVRGHGGVDADLAHRLGVRGTAGDHLGGEELPDLQLGRLPAIGDLGICRGEPLEALLGVRAGECRQRRAQRWPERRQPERCAAACPSLPQRPRGQALGVAEGDVVGDVGGQARRSTCARTLRARPRSTSARARACRCRP